MPHFTDDELSAYVSDPSRVADREAMEAHLAGCPHCRAGIASVEEVEEGLRDAEVWRQVDGFLARPARLPQALALKGVIEKENAAAVKLLTPVLRSPMRFADAKIAENPRFHTAGVARMLCAEANGLHDKRPKFSLQLADAASAIAAALTGPPPIPRLCRGEALRERANALRYLGRFAEALKALDEAEPMFDASPSSDPFDRAIVGYIRAVVLHETDRLNEALQVVRSAVDVFHEYGDEQREASARLVEAGCLYSAGKYAESATSFEAVISVARLIAQSRLLAYALQNAAAAYLSLRELDRAERYYAESMVLYDELGVMTEKARIAWSLGSILVARGDLARGAIALDVARQELLQLGLRNDHALATLEWVEVRLAFKQTAGVATACREILLQFNSEGMMRNARLALAHLHQALANQNATPELVRQIRMYIRDLPSHPTAVFVVSQ